MDMFKHFLQCVIKMIIYLIFISLLYISGCTLFTRKILLKNMNVQRVETETRGYDNQEGESKENK